MRQGFPLHPEARAARRREHPAPRTPGEGWRPSTRCGGARVMASGHYHCSVNGVGRASGRSVVAAAAYRAGERLRDETAGVEADYHRRHGVLDSFILAPTSAPAWAGDRERLWNEAERAEPRANGRLATELQVALPHDLDARARRELVEGFAQRMVERHGVAADVAIHAPGEGGDHRNVHAHILVTHRTLGREGFGEIANERTITKKVKGQDKQIGIAGLAATPADIRALRQDWEQAVNRAYELAGLDIRVDHRSHKDRGIEAEPTKHLGPTAAKMERNGKASERGDANREIEKQNAERAELRALEVEARQLGVEIIELQYQRAAQEAHDAARGRVDAIGPDFTTAAARATEPVAPIFDRDAANAAWMEQVDAAGRAKAEAAEAAQKAQEPLSSAASRRHAAETATERTPEPQRGPEPGMAHEAQSAARQSVAAAEKTVDQATHVFGDMLGGFANGVEKMLAWLSDFLAPPPPMTRDQAERKARADEEKAEARADEAARQEKEAARDEQIAEQNRREQDRDLSFAQRFGTPPTREANTGRENDDDRGRERDRER